MSLKRRNPVDQLVDETYAHCVRERPARDAETVYRWQKDEISHLRERFEVLPLMPELRQLALEAVDHWRERESRLLETLKTTKEEFLSTFRAIREDVLKGGSQSLRAAYALYPKTRGVCRNMDWVNLFSWILPQADPDRAAIYGEVGRIVTACLYIEILSKLQPFQAEEESITKDRDLMRIEARWQLAERLASLNS
ncbi:MAG: hypothetical protein WHS86_16155 [Desulfosoma sp.]